ncbi:MAG: Rieske (2Fe-2S) protein, partial [Gammaproteobacteria bacterium]|nr:Rieske (2Fe-2S) protein [Gammaproteobacteria bacterium]MBT6025228.1 Rieske (2Fe-2S) protein [Gammaproteobacteria bacterium]
MSENNQAEEREIIATVLGYCENGGTHLQPDVMKIPVIEYTDSDQLRREVDILFRQFPIIVGHVSQLSAPGTFFTHNATGVPMLITRNRDGAVKAFLNVCRHRGARVEQQACGKANTFSCPYHSWTYDLDGNLRGLPKDANFGDIDKSELGLVELPSFERHGLIWVRPSTSATPVDIDAWLAPMADQLESL